MKSTKIPGIVRYVDESQGFAVVRTSLGNFVVEVHELKKAGVKLNSCFPDTPVELLFADNESIQSKKVLTITPKKSPKRSVENGRAA